MHPHEYARHNVDRLITHGLVGNIEAYYEVTKEGVEYLEKLEKEEKELFVKVTQEYIIHRSHDWKKSIKTINHVYQHSSPEMREKIDSFKVNEK